MEMPSERRRQLEFLMHKIIEEECIRNPNARALMQMAEAEGGLRFVHIVGMEPIPKLIMSGDTLFPDAQDPRPEFLFDEEEFQSYFNSDQHR